MDGTTLVRRHRMNENTGCISVVIITSAGNKITRPRRGVMHLIMLKECKKCVAENIHDNSWETLSVNQIDDCLLQLLNVLEGNVLSA